MPYILLQPRKITAKGFISGLSILLNDISDDYHTTEIGSSGFRVNFILKLQQIHLIKYFPDSHSWLPQLSNIKFSEYFEDPQCDFFLNLDFQITRFVQSGTESLLEVMPEEYYSTDSVLELPIDKRNCLTKNERDMNYGIQYSFSNCMEECRAQIVLEACGCIPYFLPNNGNISFPLSTRILLGKFFQEPTRLANPTKSAVWKLNGLFSLDP